MKKFLILALSAALLLAFFGCGSPKEEETPVGPPAGTEDFEKTVLTLPSPTDATKATTGENNSKMYKFIGDDFTKINDALPGSYLEVTYKAPDNIDYACGEIGWKSLTEAGPIIHGNATKPNRKAFIYREDLVIGDADFTIHIFNGATLVDVTLCSAPDGYKPDPNPNATAGAQKIFIPFGSPVPGNGDLSKADYKKITTAASGTLVFYFEKNTKPDDGILKFGPKSGDPYSHWGISSNGTPADSADSWRVYTAGEEEGKGTISYTVAEIKAAIPVATAGFPTGIFNKLEINMGEPPAKAELVYIELKP